MDRWLHTEYLSTGSTVQIEVYRLLKKHRILIDLSSYNPILVGTVPIGIQVEGSDLDIICEVNDFNEFERFVGQRYGGYERFEIARRIVDGEERIKANFTIEDWPIELFGQNKPTTEQNGYRHMVVEDRMLRLFGARFRQEVIRLKTEGIKTEPAFALLLGLSEDPYARLLELEGWTDEELMALYQPSLH